MLGTFGDYLLAVYLILTFCAAAGWVCGFVNVKVTATDPTINQGMDVTELVYKLEELEAENKRLKAGKE